MALRPDNRENLMSLADQVIWAIMTYGVPQGAMLAARPNNEENKMSLADQLIWAMTS